MLAPFFRPVAKIVTFPYVLVLWFRHKCFDWGIFKSVAFDLPVVSIGNITVGGTGKTPHTELILRLCGERIQMAVLSRGYRRSSKGFKYVATDDCVAEVGDEPLQIKRKFPFIVVAVDANRVEGVKKIQHDHPQVGMVLLDDAFQYRKLRPSLSIVLTPYARPFTRDSLLPFGRLRDLPVQHTRANVVIVSKAPAQISAEEREKQVKVIMPKPCQHFFCTCLRYGAPCPLFPNAVVHPLSTIPDQVVAITGIADPAPFLTEIGKHAAILEHLKFADHHIFTKNDALRIHALQAKYFQTPIVTTEKDAMRLLEMPGITPEVRAVLYHIPVEADFCSDKERKQFVEILLKSLPYNPSPS